MFQIEIWKLEICERGKTLGHERDAHGNIFTYKKRKPIGLRFSFGI
jgi:hypothetical protein